MTQPLGEPLVISLKAELLFYARCLIHVLGGYGVTLLAALLSTERQTGGMLRLVATVFALWMAANIAAWLVSLFDEPVLQLLSTTVLVAVPFGILCGPLVGAIHPADMVSVLGGLALLMVTASLIGITLPIGAWRFVPWWCGTAMLTVVIHLVYLAKTGAPVVGIYVCALLLAVCTAADTNRAKSGLYINPHQASRLGALLWLDATNVVRQLRTRVIKG